MKPILILIFAMALSALADTNKPTFIKGTMEIAFQSRVKTDSDGKPLKGIADVYRLSANISDSALFHGTISYLPPILGTFSSVVQPASISYQVDCDVVNPANPSQTRNVGRLYGMVPIDINGTYRFNAGSLKVSINAIGRAQGFESKSSGIATGKPLIKPSESLLTRMKKEAMNISKQINGKTVAVVVKRYDQMIFQQHTLPAGPVQAYPESTVNGGMVYDYDRYVWYFNGLTIGYQVDGKQMVDKVSGTIRWVESPQRKVNGQGEYQFDVRLNEPPPSETAVFASSNDEAAFFQTDDTISALTGTMKYKDTFNGETVKASTVSLELVGNKLNKVQCINLAKLVLFSAVVPINAE